MSTRLPTSMTSDVFQRIRRVEAGRNYDGGTSSALATRVGSVVISQKGSTGGGGGMLVHNVDTADSFQVFKLEHDFPWQALGGVSFLPGVSTPTGFFGFTQSSSLVTTITSGSDGTDPATFTSGSPGTIDVVSTTGFSPSGGFIAVATSGGYVTICSYTGLSGGDEFTGVVALTPSGGGTMATDGGVGIPPPYWVSTPWCPPRGSTLVHVKVNIGAFLNSAADGFSGSVHNEPTIVQVFKDSPVPVTYDYTDQFNPAFNSVGYNNPGNPYPMLLAQLVLLPNTVTASIDIGQTDSIQWYDYTTGLVTSHPNGFATNTFDGDTPIYVALYQLGISNVVGVTQPHRPPGVVKPKGTVVLDPAATAAAQSFDSSHRVGTSEVSGAYVPSSINTQCYFE